MKYQLKVIYKDKVEPTVVLDNATTEELTSEVNKLLADITNENTSMCGIFVCNKTKLHRTQEN